MPYKTRFQHERDPKFQERMREKWRLKKRRQRRKRAAAAKKAKEEGRNIYRAPDSFIRSSEFPNKALWLLNKEIRVAMAERRPVNLDLARRAFSLRTTTWHFRKRPYLWDVYKSALASHRSCGIKGGTLLPDKTRNPKRSSYVVRGRLTAPQPEKVSAMADRTKFDPEKPLSSLAKAVQEEIAATPRKTPEPPKAPEAAPKPQMSTAKMQSRLGGWYVNTGLTPCEDEKARRIAEMRRALKESEDKEKTARKEENHGGP